MCNNLFFSNTLKENQWFVHALYDNSSQDFFRFNSILIFCFVGQVALSSFISFSNNY
jgi:hypothetical protein